MRTTTTTRMDRCWRLYQRAGQRLQSERKRFERLTGGRKRLDPHVRLRIHARAMRQSARYVRLQRWCIRERYRLAHEED